MRQTLKNIKSLYHGHIQVRLLLIITKEFKEKILLIIFLGWIISSMFFMLQNYENLLRDELYVMLMLQRSEGTSSEGVDEADKLIACLDACKSDATCIADCYAGDNEEEEENTADEDEVVKSGSLAVTASANAEGVIIEASPSDLDTLTFKTSEEVEITKVTLELYGYATDATIAANGVWLEDENGMVISNKKNPNSKGLVTLTIDKDYRAVDGSLNATVVVTTVANVAGKNTIGFKVVDVESTAASVDLPSKTPTAYNIVKYDGSEATVSTRAGAKVYNYAEGELYEVAKFKVKAADAAAILVNGFTLNDVKADVKLKDVIDDISVTIDDEEVKGLQYSIDKTKLTISFNKVEIAAKQSANFALSISLTDFDNHFGDRIDFELTDFNAVESKTSARVSLSYGSPAVKISTTPLTLQTNQFDGGKVKYTSTKLAKVEAAAGATDVILAEGTLEIPETILATFSVPADHSVIEEMRMYVAGEEFDGTWDGAANFDFVDVELTKGGKVQFKVDIDEAATKGTKVSLGSLSLSADFTKLNYDSNNTSAKAQAAGSISFADLTVTEAKASLENNADDTVEYIVSETNRKVVFDGTYTAKKADIFLNEFTISGAPAIRVGEAITFYLYLDGEEVADVNALDLPESFSKVKVAAGKSISVKVEAEVEAAATKTPANYVFTLALDGEDVDDLPVTTATAGLAEMAVVEKGSVTVSTASSKATVLLKKANTSIAQFTVKPDKGNDVYLESLGFTLVNGAVNLTADDVNVKLDGVAEDGESVYAAATEYEANIAITAGDLVSYNGNYYQAANDIANTTVWATDSATDLVALPVYPAGTPYAANDYVLYNGVVYQANAAVAAATNWNTDATKFNTLPNQIVFDLAEELDSDGITVEVTLKSKTTGTVTLDLDDVNGKDPNKSFEKRFEDALVWVSSQRDNEGSTTFVLGVSKAESSDEIGNVCLYYTNASNKKCVTSSVSDGNDDLEWTNPASAQIMIDAISYEVNGDGTCVWDGTATDTDGDSYAGPGSCVVITKNDYNDYFKVGDTYAKIFKVD